MDPQSSFRYRLVKNLKDGARIIAALQLAATLTRILEGAPAARSLLDAAVSFLLVVPLGVLTYTALSPLRSKGRLAHYVVWIGTACGVWIPVGLLTLGGLAPPLYPRWPVFPLAMIIVALVWGAISEGIETQLEQSRKAFGRGGAA